MLSGCVGQDDLVLFENILSRSSPPILIGPVLVESVDPMFLELSGRGSAMREDFPKVSIRRAMFSDSLGVSALMISVLLDVGISVSTSVQHMLSVTISSSVVIPVSLVSINIIAGIEW